jgi:hypothetical protein
MDTDSVLCVEYGDNPILVTGEYLGDLTSELDPGDGIVEYVSTGPKSYAYRCASGKEEIKVKGVTLSHSTKRKLHFDVMVEMTKDPRTTILTQPLQFVIDQHHVIRTKKFKPDEGKLFRLTMNKRKIDWHSENREWELNTRPFKMKCNEI